MITLLAGTALAAGLLAVPAAPAVAVDPPGGSATVPQHVPGKARVRLLGGDLDTFAVARSGGQVLVGSPGADLTDHGARYRALPRHAAPVSDLTGTTLRWAQERTDGTPGWVIHTSNVLTGAGSTAFSPDEPQAWTPDGWIGYADGVLTQHAAGAPDRVWLTGITAGPPTVEADASGAVVAYRTGPDAGAHYKVALITFAGAQVEILADRTSDLDGGELPVDATLSPNTVVWAAMSLPTQIGGTVYRRARAGGAVTSVPLLPYQLWGSLTATDDQVSITTSERKSFSADRRVLLWALHGTAWRAIELPGPFNSVDAEDFGGMYSFGDQFVFALGGDIAVVAGVYTFAYGSGSRISDVTLAAETISDVALNAGRVFYGEREVGAPADVEAPLFRRQVRLARGRAAPVTLGAELGYSGGNPVVHAVDGSAPAVSVSGDRAVIRTNWDGIRHVLLERGDLDRTLPPTGPKDSAVRMSGPYALVDGAVFRADHTANRPALLDLASEDPLGADIFGAYVVWSTAAGAVRMRDLTAATAATAATVAADPVTVAQDGAAGPVATWGTTVAWARTDGTIAVRTLPGETVRTVAVTGTVAGLRLSEGALSWHDGEGRIQLLDLRDPGASPVTSGLVVPGEVDDHLVAGLDDAGRVQVRTLPFGLGAQYRPRLIGALATGSLRTSSTVPVRSWKPRFDVTKPVTAVRLRIRRGTTVIATLKGSGAAGSIHDLSWNGRTTTGRRAPAGLYTWTLTATAKDGDGTLTATDGRSTIRGALTVTR